MTKLEHVTLSDEAARFAAAQVDDVLAAGVEALQERDQMQDEWLAHARQCFEQGRAAFARGEVLETTPDALMDSIEQELGIAQ